MHNAVVSSCDTSPSRRRDEPLNCRRNSCVVGILQHWRRHATSIYTGETILAANYITLPNWFCWSSFLVKHQLFFSISNIQTVSQKWSQCSRHLKQCCGIFTAVLSKRGRFFLVAPSLKKFMVSLQRAKYFYDQRFISASIFWFSIRQSKTADLVRNLVP